MAEERRLVTILAADVVGYSRLMEQDESATLAALKQRRTGVLAQLVSEHLWTLVAGLSDKILKPVMLGRGLESPTPVILSGVIGGMLADGFSAYLLGRCCWPSANVLLIEWLRQHPVEGAAD